MEILEVYNANKIWDSILLQAVEWFMTSIIDMVIGIENTGEFENVRCIVHI
jgi:hypothetical protein